MRDQQIKHIQDDVTPDNYRQRLGDILGPGKGFCVNLSVDTDSLALMTFCCDINVPYIDTVVAPWTGFYFDTTDNAERTNYALRQRVRDEKAANPGMVSWFVKEGLLILARDLGYDPVSQLRADWGTHENWMPEIAQSHATGCQSAIWFARPGAITRVHSWCPTPGTQFGYLVTHNESVSIADYFTVGDKAAPDFRPTVQYACHPCEDAVLSLHEMFGAGVQQKSREILDVDDIVTGTDELGVLIYGHDKNALWFGSRLSNAETKTLAPYQNATGMQVTFAVLAGMVWALENPNAGIVETDEMDHALCLEIQCPNLGLVEAHCTDWTPLYNRWEHFPEDVDKSDAWQFRNVLAT